MIINSIIKSSINNGKFLLLLFLSMLVVGFTGEFTKPKHNKTKVLMQRTHLKENPNHWLLFSLNRIMGSEILELYKVKFL